MVDPVVKLKLGLQWKGTQHEWVQGIIQVLKVINNYNSI